MSIIEQIRNSSSEEAIVKLIEEHVLDIETPLSWGEEAEVLENRGETNKAEILRAAEKRCFELENK